jgi:thymidylate synthase
MLENQHPKRSIEQKAHVYKEELDAVKKQIERHEQNIVQLSIENTVRLQPFSPSRFQHSLN